MQYLFLSELIGRRAAELGAKDALKIRDKASARWISISWNAFSEKIKETACALCRYGVKEDSKVGVYAQNMAECLYIDFAAFSNRAVAVPMYATSSIPQIAYIINETEISLLFVGEQLQYDHAYTVLKTNKHLKQLVLLDENIQKAEDDRTSVYFDTFTDPALVTENERLLVEKRIRETKEDDVAHLIYTSGTTGEPKGVMLTQGNYQEALRIHDIRLGYLPNGFLTMSFLPLTHIFEKAWAFFCLHKGCTLAINLDPKEIRETIKEVRPNAMCSVPRFWEKIYAAVREKIENLNPILQYVFEDAVKTGRRHNLDYRNKGEKAPWLLRQKFQLYDYFIFNRIKKEIGIENGLIYPCAGAALSDNINTFIQSINIPLIYGYGLTETTATVSCFPVTGFRIRTVGRVMPGIDVRIGEDREIQIKGKTIMSGYFRKPEATAGAFTADGWFRSGDAGYLDETGALTLTERIKDLYKTINGKYIAPQQLETRLAEDKYIETAAIIGDQRKYVTALIIPDFGELRLYADKRLIIYKDLKELCNHPLIHTLIKLRIESMQNEFANYEQIKKFTILSHPFSIESGELTNTLKMKRAYIEQKYKDVIDAMYEATSRLSY